MAREAYRSLYGDLTKLKDDSVLKDPAAGPDDDDELFELLLAVSDWVDHYCNRHFYPRNEVLLFDGNGGDRLLVPDLISVSELAQAVDGGNSFDRTWDAGDYRLLPHNAAPLMPWGHPYGAILGLSKGPAPTGRGAGFGAGIGVGLAEGFASGVANFRIKGMWGYRCFAEPSGATLAATLATGPAALTVSDGGQFRVGQTLLLGGAGAGGGENGEQLLIAAIDGNELTVSRGLNGTEPAEHPASTPLGILRWPPSVERAALIQAARIWTRAADFEPFYVDADVDTDVRLLLEPYRKSPSP